MGQAVGAATAVVSVAAAAAPAAARALFGSSVGHGWAVLLSATGQIPLAIDTPGLFASSFHRLSRVVDHEP